LEKRTDAGCSIYIPLTKEGLKKKYVTFRSGTICLLPESHFKNLTHLLSLLPYKTVNKMIKLRKEFMKHFALIFLFIFSIANSIANAEIGKPLLILADDDFPPYSYRENGKITGFDVDIIEEMAKRLNLSIKIKLYPFKRLIVMTKSGKCDGSFSLFRTKEREVSLLIKNENSIPAKMRIEQR